MFEEQTCVKFHFYMELKSKKKKQLIQTLVYLLQNKPVNLPCVHILSESIDGFPFQFPCSHVLLIQPGSHQEPVWSHSNRSCCFAFK